MVSDTKPPRKYLTGSPVQGAKGTVTAAKRTIQNLKGRWGAVRQAGGQKGRGQGVGQCRQPSLMWQQRRCIVHCATSSCLYAGAACEDHNMMHVSAMDDRGWMRVGGMPEDAPLQVCFCCCHHDCCHRQSGDAGQKVDGFTVGDDRRPLSGIQRRQHRSGWQQ